MVRRSFLIFGAMIVFLILTTWAFYRQDQQEDAAREKQRQTGFEWYEKSVALVVGIGNYSLRWPHHTYAVENAEKVAHELERQGFTVHKLLDERARKQDIEHELYDMIAPTLGPRDRFLFYFSGYTDSNKGEKDENIGYLVPVDGSFRWMNHDEKYFCLSDAYRHFSEQVVAKHVLFVIDQCVSITAWYPNLATIYRIDQELNAPNVQMLLAGSKCNRRATPEFTDTFLRAIAGEADHDADDHVHINELYDYIRYSEACVCRCPQLASKFSKSGIVFRYDPAALVARKLDPLPVKEEKALPIPMVRIEPGSFLMGKHKQRNYSDNYIDKRRVEVRKPFLIGATEVTQGQWQAVMGENPSHYKCCGADCPVENISWLDAVIFCNRLSALERLTPCYQIADLDVVWNRSCNGYRLPTDEEWEYAARAGTTTSTPVGDFFYEMGHAPPFNRELSSFAWFKSNSMEQTQPVAWKNPNAWNLYDVLGNVKELVWDCYYMNVDAQGVRHDMGGPAQCRHRVARGCAFMGSDQFMDIGDRAKTHWRESEWDLGLRLARSLAGEPLFQRSAP